MADQTAVNRGARVRINSPIVNGVLGNLAEFGSDIAGLAELQAKLVALDIKESATRAIVPSALIGAALGVGLGSLPVLLIGVAELLVHALSISRGWSYILVGGGVLIVAAILAAVCAPRIVHAFDTFRRSREELARNVAWIKTVLAHSGRTK